MRRSVCIFALILLQVIALFAQLRGQSSDQKTPAPILLKGQIEKVELVDDTLSRSNNFSYAHIYLKLRLTNLSQRNLIFLQETPICWGAEIDKTSASPELKDVDVYTTSLASSSYFASVTDWQNLKKTLYQDIPPKDKIFVLKAGDTLDFKGLIKVSIPRNKELVKELATVSMNVGCNTWSTIFDNKVSNQDKLTFINALKHKWNKEGLLWTDEIFSEPIPLNLAPLLTGI